MPGKKTRKRIKRKERKKRKKKERKKEKKGQKKEKKPGSKCSHEDHFSESLLIAFRVHAEYRTSKNDDGTASE